MHYFFIVMAVLFFVVGSTVPNIIKIEAEYARARIEPRRVEALLCWHEFETGRRATTADCPGL